MNNRHRRILRQLFARPVTRNLTWRQVASLLTALGFELEERSGSRIAVIQCGHVYVMHVPHPDPHLKPYAVRQPAQFLKDLGYEPSDLS